MRENSLDGNWVDYMTESVIIINILLLMKTFYNKTSFVMLNNTINMMFNMKNPFAIDNIHMRFVRKQYPSSIMHKNKKFISHNTVPF
jgi:hypothetical protein